MVIRSSLLGSGRVLSNIDRYAKVALSYAGSKGLLGQQPLSPFREKPS